MINKIDKNSYRLKRVRRVRAKISGTELRPRMTVSRSLKHIAVQLIDDITGKTLLSQNDRAVTGKPVEKALTLGKQIAAMAKSKGIESVVFDRAGRLYHGRVAAVAEGARQAGLKL